MNKKVLITGGAGFIGSNLAFRLLKKGYIVTILDNLKREGTRVNLEWIRSNFPQVNTIIGDIRNRQDVEKSVKNQEIIFHLAAQVAVTSSVLDPKTDFEINAVGTFNLLEAVRQQNHLPIFIFSSTNKVYGGMDNIKLIKKNTRYLYQDFKNGISEKEVLDFHSPYGCSKGAADQYVHDYARIYQIPSVVFRQSCIYGPRQFGIEDQGWIAWFIIATTHHKPITIYGDGKQVRDILYIDDLIDLFELTIKKINTAKGKIYNVGGGINNSLSIWNEFGPILERLFSKKIKIKSAPWRPGDQLVYISDISLIQKELGWTPKIKVKDGVKKLFDWVQENKELFKNIIN